MWKRREVITGQYLWIIWDQLLRLEKTPNKVLRERVICDLS